MRNFYLFFSVIGALAVPVGAYAGDSMSQPHLKGYSENEGMNHSPHGHMKKESSDFEPTREAFTENKDFLVKLVDLPDNIPLKSHFSMGFQVYDGRSPDKKLKDTKLEFSIGMRHGMNDKFAHGMNSEPEVISKPQLTLVNGVYFHMPGKWTIAVSVSEGERVGTAWFDIPCCTK